jgi:uncharacterized repeat protein (TIGR01451 family)
MYSFVLLLFGLVYPVYSVYAFDLVVTKEDYSCGADNDCSATTDNSTSYVRNSEIINYDIEYENAGNDSTSGVYITDVIPNGTCYVVNSIEANLPSGTTILYSNDGVPTFPTGGSAILPVADSNGVDCTITAYKLTRTDPLSGLNQSYIENTQAEFVGTKINTIATTDGKVKLDIPATFNQTQISAGNTGFTSTIEVINIDGDSDLDIVGVGVSAPTFVYKQTSPGVFSATQISTGNTTFIGGATIIDVDANGKLDIVAGGDNFPTYIYFQQTNGSFTETQISTGNTKFRSKLKVLDVDVDGRLDVVGGGYGGNTTIFFRESNGSFTNVNISSASTNFRGNIEAEDLDGDGDIDIAGGGYFSKSYFYRKTGARTFTEIALSNSNTNFESGLVINDIDNDGDKDLIGGGFFGDSFVYRQDASDNFIENVLTGGNTRFFSKPIVVDIEGDSDKDIIGGGYGRPTYLYQQTSPGSFSRSQISLDDTFFYSGLKSIDIDNDGDTDLIGVGFNAHSYLYKNNNDGTFDESQITSVIANFIGNIEVQDINGDSFLDVIGGSDAGKSYMLVNNGQQNFTQMEISSGNTYFKGGIKVADIDGDTDIDIVGGGDGGPTYVFYNTSIFATSGSYETVINPGENVWSWSNITVSETKPANTSILYEIKDATGSVCGTTTLQAASAPSGGIVDISSISDTYDAICVSATLATTDTTKTPSIDSLTVNYTINSSQAYSFQVRTEDDIKTQGIQSVTNTINIFPTAGDTNTLNNTASTTLNVINTPESDLTISKFSTACGNDGDCNSIADNDDDRVSENALIRYTVEFENLGKDAAEKTEIIEEIPVKTCYVVNSLETAIPADFPSYVISYSNDDKITWNYSPSASGNGTDCNVTHFRVKIKELYRPHGNFTDWNAVTDTITGYWPLDERSGTTAFNIKSTAIGSTTTPRTFDATISGGAAWQADANCELGSCLSFDGVDDKVDTTVNSSLNFSGSSFTLSAWIYTSQSSLGTFMMVRDNAGVAANVVGGFPLNITAGKVSFDTWDYAANRLTSTTTINNNQWHHIVGVYNVSTGRASLYINGVLEDSKIQSGSATAGNRMMRLGANINTAGAILQPFVGRIDEAKIYRKALSASEVMTLYENTGKSIFSTTNLIENKFEANIVANWKLDDTYSPSLDISGNNISGVWTGNVTTTSGKKGNALLFDGSGDYINSNSDAVLNSASTHTYVFWFKASSWTGDKTIVGDWIGNDTGTMVYIQTASTICAYVNNTEKACSSVPSTSVWHQGALVYDTNKIYLYINGELQASANASTADGGNIQIGTYNSSNTSSFNGSIDEVIVYSTALSGADIQNLYNNDNGIKDNTIKLNNEVFNSSFNDATPNLGYGNVNLTTNNQLISLQNTNNILSTSGELNLDGIDDYLTGGTTNFTNSVDLDAIIVPKDSKRKTFKTNDITDGLVAYWRMDDTAGPSLDSSGNAFSATWIDNTAAAAGRFANGVTFDGTGDYATVSSNINSLITNRITIAGWIKADGAAFTGTPSIVTEAFMGDGNVDFAISANMPGGTSTKIGAGFYDGTWRVANQSGNFAFGEWVHVAATYDGANIKLYINGVLDSTTAYVGTLPGGTEEWRIGRRHDVTDYFDGTLDEIRIYNRDLSNTEIGNLYSSTPSPVAHYSMDEGSGTTTLYDRSGRGNSLTLANMTSTSWMGGRNSGSALNFNGTTQFAYLSNPGTSLKPANLTVSAWIKADTFTSTGATRAYIVSEQPAGAWQLGRGYNLSADGGFAKFWIGNAGGSWITATGATSLVAGTWYHIAGTYDGTAVRVFVNGVQDGITNSTVTINYGDTASTGPTPQTFYVGAQHDATNSSNTTTANMYFFDGIIDEVKVYNFAKTAAQIRQEDMAMPQTSLDSLNYGLVGHYKLDSNGSNSAGSSGAGTINGNLNFSSPGKIDNAGTFDGSGDYLNITSSPIQESLVMTKSFWIKPTANNVAIYSYISNFDASGLDQASGTHRRSQLYIDATNKLQSNLLTYTCTVGGGSFNEISLSRASVKNIPLNQWSHVVQILDFGTNGTLSNKLYINGIFDSENSVSGVCSGLDANFLMLGWKKFYANDYSGQIDDFRMYNRVLSDIEIKGLYQTNPASGVIASKGNNFEFGTNANQRTGIGDNYSNRATFTTNAITTQLSGTNINEVYFYDTTTDRNYGDGSASDPLVWRVNTARSWYTETIDASYTACNIATHDRCGNQAFPEKVYIVGTDANLYIFDAQENAMWMKFNEAGASTASTNILSGTNGAAKAVYALNGKIYIGGSGTTFWYPLISMNFVTDTTLRYTSSGTGTWSSTIANRNTLQAYSGLTGVALVNDVINDIHAAVVNGKTFVAVGTNGGVTLINETDTTRINLTRSGYTTGQGPVFLTNDGTLYVRALQSATWDNLFVFYNSHQITTNQDYTTNNWSTNNNAAINAPWIFGVHGTTKYNSMYVTQGTSTIDGKSNTIYMGTNDSGLTIVNEKQGDESNGSSKFITKDFTSEEMIGDMRGMWPMTVDGSNALIATSTITTGTVVGDVSEANRDMQVNSTIDVLTDGVRNKALTFDGTNDYLIQNPATNYVETNADASNAVQFDTTNQQLGQGFQVTPTMSVGYVQLYLSRTGSPSGNVWVEIQTNTGTVPTNTAVTNGVSSNISAASIPTTGTWVAFRFPTSPDLASATQYHIVLKADYALSTANYINWHGDASTPAYASGVANRRNATTWSALSRDFIFKVFEAPTAYNFTTEYSAGAWVKTTASGSIQTIISKFNGGIHGAFYLYLTSAGLPAGHIELSPYTATGTTAINDGNWHHVVHTYDGDTTKIYVDGKLENAKIIRGSIPTVNSPLIIGANLSSGLITNRFNGSIDEPFLTAESLTYDQIKNMYETGKKAIENVGTNNINGTSNAINANISTGLRKYISPDGSEITLPSKIFVGTEGGGVSEYDLASDTLENFWTVATTPAINNANINALAVSTGGSFIASLDSGLSRLNDVSSRNELTGSLDNTIRGFFDKSDGYYKIYQNGTETGRTFVTTGHTPVADSVNTLLTVGAKRIGSYPGYFFDGKIKDINIWKNDLSGNYERIIQSDPEFTNWEKLVVKQNKPAGTNITYTIYPYTAGSCNHGTILFGPAAIADSVDISNISSTYKDICVYANFTTTNYKVIPSIDSLLVNYNSDSKDNFNFHVRTDASKGSEVRITNNIEINSGVIDPLIDSNTYTDQIGFDIASPDLDVDKDGYSCGTEDDCTLESGLVSLWKFNKNAYDSFGTNGGSQIGGNPKYVSGKKDFALNFDGVDDYVLMSNVASLPTGTAARSLCTWLTTNQTTSGFRFAVSYGNPSNTNAMFIGQNGADLYGGGWADDLVVSNFLITGEWNHVCLTYDGTTAKLYTNGELKTSAAKTWTLTNTIGYIGRQLNHSEHWKGSLDDTRIYNRALSANEVKRLAGQVSQSEYVQYNIEYLNQSADVALGYEIVDEIPLGTCYKVDSIENNMPLGTQVLYSTDDVPTFSTISPYIPQSNGDGVDCNITAFKITPQSFNSGLIGYWKMNEIAANKCTGGVNDSCDTSAKKNDMAWDANAPVIAAGKYGNGLDFETSSSQSMSIADNSVLSQTGSITLSAWIRPESIVSSGIIAKDIGSSPNRGYYLSIQGSKLRFAISPTGTSVTYRDSTSNITNGTWSHVTGIYNNAAGTIDLYINGVLDNGTLTGSITSSIYDNTSPTRIGYNPANGYFDGIIDEARIYNRALGANEINQLVNWTPQDLIAHIKLDEGSGTTATDSSGTNLTGTLTNGPTWASGKTGKAVNFDGTNDYIDMGTSTALDIDSNLSVSAWIYPTQQKTATIFAHGKTAGSPFLEYQLATLSTGAVRFSVNTGGALTNLDSTILYNLNQWNYVAGVYDGTNMHVYVNGILKSTAKTGPITETNNQSLIGGDTVVSEYFKGLIDDVEIYKQALTVTDLGNIFRNNLGKIKFGVRINDNISNQTSIIENIANIELNDSAEVIIDNNESTNELRVVYPSDIGGRIWNDRNGNGIQDSTEEGINGLTVSLYNDNDSNGIADGAAIATDVSATEYQTEWEYLGTTTNLVANPSFETNTTNWTNVNFTTFNRDNTDANNGSYSIRTSKTSVAATNEYITTSSITINPNTSYTFSTYVKKVTATGTGTFYIWWYNGSGTYLSTSSIPLSSGTHNWQRYSFTATSPATAASVRLIIATDGTTVGSNWDAYIDSFQLEQNPTVTPYCDGSLVAFGNQQWNGTAHASSSTCDYGSITQTATSLGAGRYKFEDVNPANKFLVGIADTAQYDITTQYSGGQNIDNNINPITARSGTILINTNQIRDNIDIGLKGNMSISGYVWEDLDNSGSRDTENAARQGMKGIKLKLYEDSDNNQIYGSSDRFIIEGESGTSGVYNFAGLLPGKYIVVVSQASFEQGQPLYGCISSNGNYPAVADYGRYIGDYVVSQQIDLSPGIPPDNGGLSYLSINFGFLEGEKTKSSWLNGWNYRKAIMLAGNSSTLTNHQVLVQTDTKSLITSGKMLSDCRDIRFIDADETTLLSHWLESDCTTDRARIWVKIPSISTTAKTIYMYYGKEDATSISNGITTFDFFDDFNNNTIDFSKWQIFQGSWVEAGGVLKQVSNVSQNPKKAIMKTAPSSDDYVVSAKIKIDGGTNIDERAGLSIKTSTSTGAGYNYVFNNHTTKNTLRFLDDGIIWGNTTNYIWNTNQWHRMDLVSSGGTLYAKKWRVGVAAPSAWENSQAWTGRSGYPALNGGAYDGLVSFDDAYVRKHASPDATATVLNEQIKTPVAYWNFHENTGTTAYNSYGVSTINGTLTGGPVWSTGKYGTALTFDGVDDYISIPDSTTLSPDLGTYTISSWIKTNFDFSAVGWVFANYGVTTANIAGLRMNTNETANCFFRDASSNTATVSGTTALNDNNWHHVTCVLTQTTASVYVDGVLQNTVTATSVGNINTTGRAKRIGAVATSVTQLFTGQIDDIRIYNYARSQQQILDDMNGKTP